MPRPDEKTVGTICGPFDRKRLESLKETVEAAESDLLSETNWEGQSLDVKFGRYLIEFVETRMAQRGHNGL